MISSTVLWAFQVKFKVNGIPVVEPNIPTVNGLLHLIEKPLFVNQAPELSPVSTFKEERILFCLINVIICVI